MAPPGLRHVGPFRCAGWNMRLVEQVVASVVHAAAAVSGPSATQKQRRRGDLALFKQP